MSTRVTSIDPVSTVQNNVVEYGVTLRLSRPANLRAGESLQVTVTTGSAKNALVVPSTAVTGSGRAATVTVLRNGKQTVVPVTVGMQGDITSQITSGLKAGDQVVITPASTSGTARRRRLPLRRRRVRRRRGAGRRHRRRRAQACRWLR